MDTTAAGFMRLSAEFCSSDYEPITQCYVATVDGAGFVEGDQIEVVYMFDGLAVVDTVINNSTQLTSIAAIPLATQVTPCETYCKVENIPDHFQITGTGSSETFAADTYSSVTVTVVRGTASVSIGGKPLDYVRYTQTYNAAECEFYQADIVVTCSTADCEVKVHTIR